LPNNPIIISPQLQCSWKLVKHLKIHIHEVKSAKASATSIHFDVQKSFIINFQAQT